MGVCYVVVAECACVRAAEGGNFTLWKLNQAENPRPPEMVLKARKAVVVGPLDCVLYIFMTSRTFVPPGWAGHTLSRSKTSPLNPKWMLGW